MTLVVLKILQRALMRLLARSLPRWFNTFNGCLIFPCVQNNSLCTSSLYFRAPKKSLYHKSKLLMSLLPSNCTPGHSDAILLITLVRLTQKG